MFFLLPQSVSNRYSLTDASAQVVYHLTYGVTFTPYRRLYTPLERGSMILIAQCSFLCYKLIACLEYLSFDVVDCNIYTIYELYYHTPQTFYLFAETVYFEPITKKISLIT